MADKKPYYITTAIAYTSGKPHIGNTYEIILADAIARYKRSQGYDVFFQTGTKPYYITTAIAYTSGKPHIGNTYEIILADAIARYKRSQGYDVFFQTGTDEHGQKIELKAEEAGVTPKEFVDNVSGEIKKIWDLMDTSYDKFIRTTDEDHEKQVQKIFKKLYDQGDIYKGHYEGMYCTPCESFFTESQLVDGTMKECTVLHVNLSSQNHSL